MTPYELLLQDFDADARNLIPGFAVVPKSESWHQRLLGKLLFYNPHYMERFTTTLYPKVYLSETMVGESGYRRFEVLSHELVHLYDQRESRIGFPVGYLFPQVLYVLSVFGLLGAFLSPWWLLWLLFMFAAAPIPAYWRMKAEMRGYAMTCAVQFWSRGYVPASTREFIEKQFTGWNYYRMWPFAEDVRSRLQAVERTIRTGEICEGTSGVPYKVVRDLMEKHGLKRVVP